MFYLKNKQHFEGPVAAIGGALLGGLIGGGGTMAGLLTAGGMMGMALGGVAGTLLGSSLEMPDFDVASPQSPTQQEVAEATPAEEAAVTAPATTEEQASGVGEVATDTTSTSSAEEFTVGESAAPTEENVAKGELTKKRRGRISTILSSGANASEFEDEEELLGGAV